jgi:hypothetical protein
MRALIVAAAARAIFVQWWADRCICGNDWEECRHNLDGLQGDHPETFDPTVEHASNDPGQCDLMEVAPETHPEALKCAEAFIASVERLNGRTAEELLAACNGPDEDDFGHYLAMAALGHGVGLSDDYSDLPTIRGPMIGFYHIDVSGGWEVSERLASNLTR